MPKKLLLMFVCVLLGAAAFGLRAQAYYGEPVTMLQWDVISQDMVGCGFTYKNVTLTPDISDIAHPAVKVVSDGPVTICLKELSVAQQHLDRTRLTFSAEMKSDKLQGAAYLGMWVHVLGSDKGNFIARSLLRPLQGTMDWNKYLAPFDLAMGAVPDKITLTVTLTGKGTVWLRNIKLIHQP